MPTGYCLDLYCTSLSQRNHCKYITLAQIGLILVNGLVILKLTFIISKGAGGKGKKFQIQKSNKFLLSNEANIWCYRHGHTWHHLLSSSELSIFYPSPLNSPFPGPAIDSFSLSFKSLMHSKNFQLQTLTTFAVWGFVSSIEGPNITQFYNHIGKIIVNNSMNWFYWEHKWTNIHLAPATSSVPQHHLTKRSVFHKGIWDFFNKISTFNMLLLHSFQSGSQK